MKIADLFVDVIPQINVAQLRTELQHAANSVQTGSSAAKIKVKLEVTNSEIQHLVHRIENATATVQIKLDTNHNQINHLVSNLPTVTVNAHLAFDPAQVQHAINQLHLQGLNVPINPHPGPGGPGGGGGGGGGGGNQGVGRAAALGGAIGGLAGDLAGSALDQIKEFASGSVEAFASVEDALGAASVQFGKALPQVEKFANDAAKNFGISKKAALDAENTFGTLGKSAGLQGGGLADFSTKLAGLAGDLASFKGTSTEQAIEAVGAALRGESEPIRAYGVLLDEASIKAEALATGLVKPVKNADKVKAANIALSISQEKLNEVTKKFGPNSLEAQQAQGKLVSAQGALKKATEGTIPQLTQQQKVMATQSLLFKQTSDAQGDYNRTSTSTANTQKTLQATTENLQAQLGAKLAPIMTSIRQKFLDFLNAVTDTNGTFQKDFLPVIKSVAGFFTGVLIPAFAAVVRTVNENKAALAPLVAAYVGFRAVMASLALATAVSRFLQLSKAVGIARAIQLQFNVALSANPIGLVVVAVAALAAGLIYAYKHSESFRILVNKAFRSVLESVDKMLGGVQALFSALGHVPGFGWAKTAADKIAGARDRVKELANSIDTLPSTKNITVKVNGTTNGINSAIATAAKQDRLRAATGGYISGAGGPTDDKIPALLSNGEYVIRAAAVAKYGPQFMDQLNAGRYAKGGSVGINLSLPPRNIASVISSAINAGARAVSLPGLGSGKLGKRGEGDYPEIIAYERSTGIPFRVNSTTGGSHAAGSYHYAGRAVDFGPAGLGSSTPAGQAIMRRIFESFLPVAGSLAELFFTPMGYSIKNGQRTRPIAAAEHYSHVHVAYANGGLVKGSALNPHIRDTGGPLLPGFTYNGTGRNEMVIPHFATGGLVQSQEFINEARALKDLITSIKRIFVPDGSLVRRAASSLQSGGVAGLTSAVDANTERLRLLQFNRDLQDANLARQRAIADQRSAKSHADMLDATTRRLEAEKQIKQLNADEETLREQRIIEALQTSYSRLNDLVSEYVDLIKQRTSIDRKYAVDQIRLQQQLVTQQQQVREEFSKTVAAAVAARSKTFQTDATSGYTKNAVTPISALLENLKSQSGDLKEYSQGLAAATAKGLSPEFLKTLGINGVEDLDRLKAILNANGSELLQLGQAFADRQISAARAANSEQLNLVGDLGDQILAAVDDRNEKLFANELNYQNDLKALHEQYVNDILDVQQQIADIGKDTGRSYAENVALAMQSGIPAISAALADVQKAVSAASSYTPGGTSSSGGGTTGTTTGIVASVPLPSRTLANDVLIMSTPVGQLTDRQKQYASLYHLALGSLVPPINPPLPTRSQTVDSSISNHAISTLTPRQEMYASLYKLPVVLRDKGGYLEPGMTLVKNATGKREAVLDATQTEWLKKAAQSSDAQQTDEAMRELVYEFRMMRAAYERSNQQQVTLKRTRVL